MEPISLLLLGLTTICCCLGLLLLCGRGWRTWRRMSRLPNPPAYPLVGTAYQVAFLRRKDLLPRFTEITRQHWPLFRTWVSLWPELHICTAKDMETVMTNSDLIEKSVVYSLLEPWLGQGLLTSKGAKWYRHRKLLTPAFHFKILDNFVDVFAEQSQVLVQELSRVANGRSVDIYPYITRCALDIICETAMGTKLNVQKNAHSEYGCAVSSAIEITTQRMLKPWLFVDFIFRRTACGREYYKNLRVLHGFTRKVIQEKKALRQKTGNGTVDPTVDDVGIKRRLAFLDLMLDVSEDGQQMTDDELQEEVDTFMFEGHDTTAVAMTWALLLLSHHQDVQQKVFEELNDIFGGSDRQPTMQDLQSMKYLEMVIKETLRLYPSVPYIARTVNKEVQIGGHTIPPGVTAVMQIFMCHRDPEVWPDPERFDPDRFLPERVLGRHPFAYVPFSGGARNCIGQKFAVLEEKAVLSSVVRNFRLECSSETSPTDMAGELILRPLGPVILRLLPRTPLFVQETTIPMA